MNYCIKLKGRLGKGFQAFPYFKGADFEELTVSKHKNILEYHRLSEAEEVASRIYEDARMDKGMNISKVCVCEIVRTVEYKKAKEYRI